MAKGFLLNIEQHKTVTIPLLFVLSFLGIVIVAGTEELEQTFTIRTVADTTDKFFESVYVKIGFLSIFLYELVPSVFRLLSTTGFYIGLLNEGINPMVLIILTSVGRIFGFYLLYVLGRFLFRIFKKKNREIADADHILHKYKLIVFFLVPFFGALGDIVMIVAGHQRIGFLKVIPLLFLANVLRTAIWLYVTIAQIQVVNP